MTKMHRACGAWAIAFAGASCAISLPAANANNYPVMDGDTAGLVAAINSANSNPGPDTITLAVGGNYTLSAADHTSGYTGPSGLPAITSEILIEGQGATIARNSAVGTPNFRILFVGKTGVLLLRDTVIRNGRAEQGQAGYTGGGAGIRNDGGFVRIETSTITGNSGSNLLLGTGDNSGGGIRNYGGGTLIVINSTISHNTGYGGRTGGGIHNESYYNDKSTTTIINSTIFENRADGPGGFAGRGDALSHFASGAPGGGFVVKNSVIASPSNGLGADCYGVAPTSQGHNISSDNSCGLSGAGDLSNTDPKLGALTANGGKTPTHAPLAGSAVINAVPVADCTDDNSTPLSIDQRGSARPVGPTCDIGSVEASVPICCPPLTASHLEAAFSADFYAGANPNLKDKYRLVMQPKPAFKLTDFSKQMQAYINYAHALDPSITSVTIEIAIIDICATGAAPPAYFNLGNCAPTVIGGNGNTGKLTWTFGGVNAPPVYSPAAFFKFPAGALSKGVWYAVAAGVYFNGDVNNDPPANCENQVHFWHRE